MVVEHQAIGASTGTRVNNKGARRAKQPGGQRGWTHVVSHPDNVGGTHQGPAGVILSLLGTSHGAAMMVVVSCDDR